MNEESVFEQARFWRRNLVKLLESMTEKELDEIPSGFNNNPRWNLAHSVVTWDSVITNALGQDSQLPSHYGELFARGTSPKEWGQNIPSKSELLEQVQQHAERLEELASGKLDQEIGFEMLHLKTIEEAFLFLTSHEALHVGTASAQKQTAK
ncbi:DinB family protein [Alkalibacillus haloalkaliphilus]|uniref:DinB family protein n=1 Tax=Alkalibacillus haloalkaliphilus TaxID=94136 RepID=UPI00030685D9|nr:DinB family protein [Alkalibacillus haloalkaliphilus]